MTNRTACATILGYYYQFDKTILEILSLHNNTDCITIEGIEDIDINVADEKTAVQCKYLSSKNYCHSAIREPIIFMLSDFVTRSKPINYKLYAYFNDENVLEASPPVLG